MTISKYKTLKDSNQKNTLPGSRSKILTAIILRADKIFLEEKNLVTARNRNFLLPSYCSFLCFCFFKNLCTNNYIQLYTYIFTFGNLSLFFVFSLFIYPPLHFLSLSNPFYFTIKITQHSSCAPWI